LIPFANQVTRVIFSEDAAASYVVVVYGGDGELSGEDDVGVYSENDPPAQLWRTEDGSRIATLRHPLYESADLEYLYSGIGEVTFIPRDTAAYLYVEHVEAFPAEVDPDFGSRTPAYSEITDVVLSTAGGSPVEEPLPETEPAPGSAAPKVYRKDPDAGYAIVQPAAGPAEYHMPGGSVISLPSPVQDVIFSSSGRYFVPLYENREYEVRSADGAVVGQLDLGSLRCRITWLEFGPDDRYLVLKDECVWYAASTSWQLHRIDGTLVDTLPIDSELDSIEYSPDGRYIVAYMGERPALIYSLEKLGPPVYLDNANWVEFSPVPGSDAFLGLYDGRLALRDARNGAHLGDEHGLGTSLIQDVSFSPSRRHLVVWRRDESSEIWFWDKELWPLTELGLGLAEYLFDPAESRLYTRYKDGRAYILDLNWLRELNIEPAPTMVEQWERIFCQGPWAAAGLSDRELDEVLFAEPPRACLSAQ
jgi:hypothetical protein